MNITPPFTRIVESLPDTVPFVGPETLERKRGKPFSARIGANESAFGISPRAREALINAVGQRGCSWYGDPENYALRSLLSEKHTIARESICVDAGIDSLLGLTIRLFVEPGDVVVTSDGAYPTVNYHVSAFGGVLHKIPYCDHHEDSEALAEAANRHKARLVYLANPDNPMGTSLDARALQSLIEKLPADCLLMLDEAYIEFMQNRTVLPLNVDNTNVIRFRTFSKAYGLAGMRIGYLLAHPDLVAGYNRIRNHFGVNRLAQIAAEASLQDDNFLANVADQTENGRQRIYRLAKELGLASLPSATNFVAVDLGSVERATQLTHRLAEAGVFIRKPVVAPQDTFFRIGVGTEHEQVILEEAMRKLLWEDSCLNQHG